MFLKKALTYLAAALIAAVVGSANTADAGPMYADIVVVVDESGSMGGEHAFIGPAMISLDSSLQGNGIGVGGTNQFGLVGFGGGSGHTAGHTHSVGGGSFGTSAQFSAATGGLVLNGGTEDGYSGIAHALTYPFRSDSARNIILVTDEDRDNFGGPNKAAIAQALQDENALLNVIVNAQLRDGTNQTALGIDSDGNAYIADGMGGFMITAGGHVLSAFGTTNNDYIDLALSLGGGAWDLNQLRAGGLTGQSFAAAFTQFKTEEIQEQAIPEPASIAVWSLLLLAGGTVVWLRRRKVQMVA